DHTTSYAHGPQHPLGLVLQYSGIGLWGRHYTIQGPSSVNYALIPHAGQWDRAGVDTESAQWNEPMLAALKDFHAMKGEGRKSLLELSGTGWEVTSLTVEGENLQVRLFNAAGDETTRRVQFDGNCTKAELVELDGRVRTHLQAIPGSAGKASFEFA